MEVTIQQSVLYKGVASCLAAIEDAMEDNDAQLSPVTHAFLKV